MILLDANLLIYAYDHSSPFQKRTREWMDRAIETEPVIGLPWISILAFLRITTHPALAACQSFGLAAAIVDDWLALPNVRVVGPGASHWAALKRTAEEAQARGAFVADAALAALAIETGATLCSHDKGFRRFAGVKLFDPLGCEGRGVGDLSWSETAFPADLFPLVVSGGR